MGKVINMPTQAERLSVVEIKVHHVNEKLDDLKVDVKEMHDCLDNTRDTVLAQLNVMTDEYRTNASKYYEHANQLNDKQSAQHEELAGKIDELEKFKNKWTYMLLGGAAVLGWVTGHIDKIASFVK
jgi:hypothetical protein